MVFSSSVCCSFYLRILCAKRFWRYIFTMTNMFAIYLSVVELDDDEMFNNPYRYYEIRFRLRSVYLQIKINVILNVRSRKFLRPVNNIPEGNILFRGRSIERPWTEFTALLLVHKKVNYFREPFTTWGILKKLWTLILGPKQITYKIRNTKMYPMAINFI